MLDRNKIEELKLHTDKIREFEKPNDTDTLTKGLLQILTRNAISHLKMDYNKNQVLNPMIILNRPINGLCGCVGPRNNEPYCSCKMRNYAYEYRYDILLNIIDNYSLEDIIN